MRSRRNKRHPSVSMSQPSSGSSHPLATTSDSTAANSSNTERNAKATSASNRNETAVTFPPSPSDSPNCTGESTALPNWWSDRYAVALLIALYTAQGLPMGLAFGAIPFLLKERGATYAEIARFSLVGLPYSLKLLIAPIVDSLYFPSFGRRKSWIVPVQLVLGGAMFALAPSIHNWVSNRDVASLTTTFLTLVTLTATQDIAVDGWSLTVLKPNNIVYASTCQSLGLSIGFFSTFTIFLSFSNAEFCDQYFKPFVSWILGDIFHGAKGAIVDLIGTLRTVGFFYLALTIYVAIWKKEAPSAENGKKSDGYENLDDLMIDNTAKEQVNSKSSPLIQKLRSTYKDMFFALRLPAVKSLIFCLLIARVGVSAYDNVTPLKLLELGFSKEKMASMAVIQAPFSLIGTILAGRWVANRSPIRVYLFGFCSRILLSLLGPVCVVTLNKLNGEVTTWFYVFVLSLGVLYSFSSECLMFVAMGAFFVKITSSSVHIAGSYLTLLNTATNMGGIWHKALVLWLVDKLTARSECQLSVEEITAGKKCDISIDGYYVLTAVLLPVALMCGIHLFRTLPKLEKLTDSAWKASR